MTPKPQSNGEWYDLTRERAPRNRVLAFRNARGVEWLAMNEVAADAVAWSFIR